MREHFLQAAGRHLRDAQILYNQQRFDNAVYLSTYSVECILKLLLDFYTNTKLAKSYNHNLLQLNDAITVKLLVLYPQLSNQHPLSIEQLKLLSAGHPERRYWTSNYINNEQALSCLQTTKELYQHTVSLFILDGHISLNEV